MKRKSGTVRITAWAIGILLAGAWAAPARAGTIRIGNPSKNLNTMPMYLAKAKGIFKKYGVNVEIVYVKGGSKVTKALVARKVDMMYNGPIATMKAMQKGAKIKFVMAPTVKNDYLLVARSKINSIRDLVGAKVGISRPGAISYIMPRIIIQKAGVNPDKVKYIPIGTSGPRRKALIAGKIDAAVMHIESALKASSRPYLHSIGSVAEAMPGYPFFWLSVHNDLIKERRKDVVAVVAGIIEGNRLTIKNKAAVIAEAKKHMGLKEKWLAKGYDYLIKIGAYSVNGGLTKAAYKLVLGIGRRYKQVKKDLPIDKFLTLDIQNEALKIVGRQ